MADQDESQEQSICWGCGLMVDHSVGHTCIFDD